MLKDLQQVERGIKRCLDFITGGDGDPGSVRDELRRLEARKREIDIDRKVQQDDMEIAIYPNLANHWMRKRPVHKSLKLIRSLIDRIEVHPSHERGCKVIVIGAIAQIFAFAQQKAAKNNGTFLMVAEEGFEPPTHGL